MADNASALSSSRPDSPTDSEHPAPLEHSQPHLHRIGPAQQFRFQWDAVARRQGPPSVSDTTESRGDLLDLTSRNDLMLNVTSMSSASLPQNWSSSQYGFNAISTVLNNPKTRPAPLKSSRAPFPSGPSPDLPRIRRKDFDGYLKTIAPEWETFQHNQQLAAAAANEEEEAMKTPRPGTAQPEGSGSAPRQPLKPSGSKAAPPPLATVPPVFFERDFNLADPKTFSLVTEELPKRDSDREVGLDPSPASSTTNLVLQDQLSQYLDVVEQHLTIEISSRSNSFFAALSNLQSLQAEGTECLSRIRSLKEQLVDVDEKQAKKGLHITRLLMKMDNIGVVEDGVRAVQAVGESVNLIKNLVGTGEYFEALGMIDNVESMFDTEKQRMLPSTRTQGAHLSATNPSPLHLASITALSSLPKHLRELSSSISSSLSADLVALLRADLTREREQKPVSGIDVSGPAEVDVVLRDRLSPLVQGLLRTDGVEGLVTAYREVALAEIRATVRNHIPPSAWDAEDIAISGNSTSSGKDVKSMAHPEFLQLVKAMYSSLLQRITTISTHIACISSILSHAPSGSTSSQQELQRALSDILPSVTELSNTRASKVISIRSAEHAQLSLPDFLEIFNESWRFVVTCEVIARKMIVGLRGVVVGQAKAFLQAFHQVRITDSAKFVEDEVWAQVEVAQESQRKVNLIVEAAISDPLELILRRSPDGAGQVGLNGTSNGRETPVMNGTGPTSPLLRPPLSPTRSISTRNAKVLTIEDRSYYVVGATLQVLELLVDYLKAIVNLTLLTTDAMSRIIEFLKAFNSRTCQVVLGAGAMRSAGLKNITAKHLALASQSLSVMIALIPYVRETFRRHLNPKQAVMLVEFDKLKRDYQEHQNEIHAKLIAIMGDRLSVHCRSLSEIRWDQPPPAGKPSPNAYMEILVKETATLHKVLSKYLAQPTVELIMSQVFASVTHGLAEEYQKIQLPNQDAKTRLLQDARYLNEKLASLKGVSHPSAMLETVVMEKQLPRRGSPFPTRRTSTFSPPTGSGPTCSGDPTTPRGSLEGGGAMLSPPANGVGGNRSPMSTHSLLARDRTSTTPSPLPTPGPNSPNANNPQYDSPPYFDRQNATSSLAQGMVSSPPANSNGLPSDPVARIGLGLGFDTTTRSSE